VTKFNSTPDTKILEKLLECGADINTTDSDGNKIFHLIIQNLGKFNNEYFPFLQLLLQSGPNLNKKNSKGIPPLFLYKLGGSWQPDKGNDEQLLQALVDAGMDINARNSRGETILYQLIRRKDAQIETAEKLVRLGADVSITANRGSKLLHYAVESERSMEWIQFLTSNGIDPASKDGEGNTLIHLAIKGFGEIASDHELPRGRVLVDALLEFGVPPGEKDGFERTALHLASLSPQECETAQSYEHHWIDIVLKSPMFEVDDVNARDQGGATALHYAAGTNEFNVAKLLQAGADPTVLTLEGVSPLHVACRARQPNVVGLLLAAYKERGELERLVNICDTAGTQRTSLHIAARSGVPETVWYLLAHGVNVASVDQNGYTPLHALTELPEESVL
jgi:ankyrin repeat protein